MKKLKRSILKHYPPTLCYLDDIIDIYNILKDNCKSVSIQANNFEFDSPSGLKELNVPVLHRLSLKGIDPYIDIDFRPFELSIWISEENIITKGMLSSLEQVISKCERKVLRHLLKWSYIYAGLIFIVGIFLTFRYLEGLSVILSVSSLIIIFILAYYYSNKSDNKTYSTLFLSQNKYNPNFFVRNKDELLSKFIFLVLGAAITYIITRFF
jgi:hypothetical protein